MCIAKYQLVAKSHVETTLWRRGVARRSVLAPHRDTPQCGPNPITADGSTKCGCRSSQTMTQSRILQKPYCELWDHKPTIFTQDTHIHCTPIEYTLPRNTL
jgi:hypothetical protein